MLLVGCRGSPPQVPVAVVLQSDRWRPSSHSAPPDVVQELRRARGTVLAVTSVPTDFLQPSERITISYAFPFLEENMN